MPGKLGVLRWIAEGCPAGVMSGEACKVTALALQSRRLVTIARNKKRKTWPAQPPGLHERSQLPAEQATPERRR